MDLNTPPIPKQYILNYSPLYFVISYCFEKNTDYDAKFKILVFSLELKKEMKTLTLSLKASKGGST